MKRLYYLADDLDTVEDVAEVLRREGIGNWHFHVLSKDDAGLYRHHLHSATPLQQRDIIRGGERGALLGFGAGVLIALFSRLLGIAPEYSTIVMIIAIGLPTLFGAWVGGLVGLALENHKVARFHRDIEDGHALLMIDVDRRHHRRIQSLLRAFALKPGGEDSTLIMPFRLGHA